MDLFICEKRGSYVTLCYFKTMYMYHSLAARTILILQKQGTSTTLQNSVGHDGNPVSKEISLIHEVCGQEHCTTGSVLLEDSPDLSPGIWIQSRWWLIQNHNLQYKKIVNYNTINAYHQNYKSLYYTSQYIVHVSKSLSWVKYNIINWSTTSHMSIISQVHTSHESNTPCTVTVYVWEMYKMHFHL